MSTIVAIKGTNGSGKSSVIRALMAKSQPTPFLFDGEEAGYRCRYGQENLFVLGKYKSACGGLDASFSYADIFHGRIKKAEQRWPEEDFSVFWKMRKDVLPKPLRLEDNPGDVGVKPPKQNHYRLTGQVIMMDMDWPCFANSFRKSSKTASAQ